MTAQAPDSRDLDGYERQYRASPFEEVQAAVRRRFVLDQVRRVRPASLLEVGCAQRPLFSDLPEVACTVVEPAAGFAQQARALARTHAGAAVVAESLIEDFSPPAERFEMVVVSGLLHEVPDPLAVLRSVRRCCAPGAVVHVNVPNAQSMHRLLAVAMGLVADPRDLSPTQLLLQQQRTYDLAMLQDQVGASGFRCVESGSYFVKPFTHAQMQHLVDLGFLTPALLQGLERLAHHMPGHGSEIFVNARADG